MKGIVRSIIDFVKDERGLSTAEIAIIGGFLAIAAVGLGAYLIPKIRTAGNKIGTELEVSNTATY